MLQSIFTCRTYQTFRSFFGHRFHAKRRRFGKAHFSHSHFIMQKTIKLLSFPACLLPILYLHKYLPYFRGKYAYPPSEALSPEIHSAEPTYGAQTHIQIQRLAQSHIQGTDTTSYRSSQRTFYAHTIFLESLHRLIRQPGTCFVEARSPASTSIHSISCSLPYAFFTAAFTMACMEGVISTPTPSPVI